MEKKKCVILLGAGFPTIWGASITSELTNKIRHDFYSNSKSDSFQKLFRYLWGEDLSQGNNFEEDIALFEGVAEYHGQNEPIINNELLDRLGILENGIQICGYSYSNISIDHSSPLSISRSEFLPNYLKSLQNCLSYSTRGEFRDQVSVNEDILRFLNEIREQYHLNIYSLNYDLSIPVLQNRIDFQYVGFDDNGYPISESSLLNSQSEHYLTLHGNFWMYDNFSTIDPTHSFNLSREFQSAHFSSEHYPVISGLQKQGKLIVPLDRFLKKFEKDLNESTSFIIIGYSGGDRHVNEKLAGFRHSAKVIDPSKNIMKLRDCLKQQPEHLRLTAKAFLSKTPYKL